jgi:hypothetical protein
MRLLLKATKSDDRGAELFEFALVLPLLLSLLIGILWMARAYNIYQTITRAAREGARAAVVRTCASCGNAIPSDASVRTVVTDSLSASALDLTKVTSSFAGTCPNGQTCDCPTGDICIIRDVPLNSSTPPELGVVVSLGYPVDFPIPFVNVPSITVNTQVQMREEN